MGVRNDLDIVVVTVAELSALASCSILAVYLLCKEVRNFYMKLVRR